MVDTNDNSVDTKMRYDNFSRFSVRFIDKSSRNENAVLYLRRYGLSWRLAAVKLPLEEHSLVQKDSNYIKTPSPPRASVVPPAGSAQPEVTARINALREMVKGDPKNLSAWVELGNLYFDTDRPEEAIEAYSNYLALNPDNPDVRTDLGIMYRKLGDIDRALEEFREAAQIAPRHVNSRYNIGVILLHDKQDANGAVKAWEEYLLVDSKSERAERVRMQIEKLKKIAP